MTILFFTRRFHPLIGGVEKHVLELSKKLLKMKYSVIVVTEHVHKSPAYEVINNIKIYRIKTGKDNWFKKFNIWRELWKIRHIIKQAEIIHCHDIFFWYLPFRFLYSRKKVFTTFHGYESFPISQKAIFMRKLSEKLSSGNICIGDFIPKWYGTKPNLISYGAVEIPPSSKSSTQKNSALFIGRLDDQTGIIAYNKAFEILRKKHTGFEFLVVGEGEHKKILNKNAKQVGFQKNPEKHYATYRFAFVSRYLAILEAMAHKRLVFAHFDNPVKEDYLKMSPFSKLIIIEKDPKRLAQKVEYYLKYPQKEKDLIQKAFTYAKKQSWENLTSAYLSLWQKE